MDRILVQAYYRIRFGRIEHVREHPRRQWRWATRCVTDAPPSDRPK